jgi:competence protein ComEC
MPHLSLGLTLALTSGLVVGVLMDGPVSLVASIGLSGAWTVAVLAYRRQQPHLLVAALAMTAAVAGLVHGRHAVDNALHTTLREALERRYGGFALDAFDEGRLDEPVRLDGRLRGDAAPTPSGVSLTLDVTRVWMDGTSFDVSGGVSLGVGGSQHADHLRDWTRGRTVRLPALLRRPARYLNEGLGDQERALARRGISLVGAVKSAAVVEVMAPASSFDETAARIRARTRAALARHVAPAGTSTPSAAIATAILIGDRSGLDLDLERRLQEAGTYHVMAISGGNVAILAGTLLVAFRAIGQRGRVATAVTLAGVVAYAVVAEGGASVARASLMAAVYLAVRLIDQRTSPFNAVAVTGAAMLAATPLAVVDVGFWLTFGASAGILAAVSRAGAASSWRRALSATVFATIAAEAALAPVSTTVFQRVTIAGLALNLVALPAMAVVQIAAMAVVATDALGLLVAAGWAGRVVHGACVALTESARLVDAAPWLTWRVPSPSPAVAVSYYAALVLVAMTSAQPRCRRTAAVIAAGLLLWMATAPAARTRDRGDGRLHVSMLDVGQGDALLVTFPNGRRLAVDGGGASPQSGFDIGERVVGPALRARGILTLDYVAVTHADPDHVGGVAALVRDFAPREVWWGVPVPEHAPSARVRAAANGQRAAWRTLQRGDVLEIGDVAVRVHHPPRPDWERRRVRNDDSLVLELAWRDVSVLLTGDIGSEVERDLAGELALRPRVVLKVAHHGSATSTSAAFVERARPLVALVGVGRGNPYGHPVVAVLDRLHAVGARVFRTDLEGQIDVVTDGREIAVRTFTGTRLLVERAGHEGTKARRQ